MDAVLEALAAFAKGVKPNAQMTKVLGNRGWIRTDRVTHLQSTEEEYIPIDITQAGEVILRRENLMPTPK